MGNLVHQAGLAHARLPHQGDHLAMSGLRLGQGLVQCCQLALPPHKGGQAPRRGGLQARAHRTWRRVSSHTATGSASPFTGTGPKRVTCTRPSTSRRVAV